MEIKINQENMISDNQTFLRRIDYTKIFESIITNFCDAICKYNFFYRCAVMKSSIPSLTTILVICVLYAYHGAEP